MKIPRLIPVVAVLIAATVSGAQEFAMPQGDVISREVREMYDRGLEYLVKT